MNKSTNIDNNPFKTKNPVSEIERTFNCKYEPYKSSQRCDFYYNRNKPTIVNSAINSAAKFLRMKAGKKRKTTKKIKKAIKKTKKNAKKHRRKTNKKQLK